MPSPALSKFNHTSKALAKLSAAGATRNIEKALVGVENLPMVIRSMFKRATAKMIPVVRRCLAENYKASGVGVITHRLKKASVDNAEITFEKDGIYVKMSQGEAERVYAAAGTFRYGAVRNTKFKATYIDLPTGQVREYAKGKGGLIGAKAKRTIKRAAFAGKGAKSSADMAVIDPKPPFFSLDNKALVIEEAFLKFLQEEVDEYLAKQASSKGAA